MTTDVINMPEFDQTLNFPRQLSYSSEISKLGLSQVFYRQFTTVFVSAKGLLRRGTPITSTIAFALRSNSASARHSMAPSSSSNVSDHIVRRVDNIVKSAEDKRDYRALTLKNGLSILLVSDPTTDKSACALDVNAGHLHDPWELPGLAHFCEHMLFLGTEKYPEENDYQKFLNAHGGSYNAYTATDHTNYHFDVPPEHLLGALDRFAQFFLCPLFTESATEREVCAVDSEHNNNIQHDTWRLIQLDRSLSNPKHDYSKFGTGNKQTLLISAKEKGLEPHKELLAFHKKFYSANLMRVCVLGKESLDELTDLTIKLFADVPNKGLSVPEWPEHPYKDSQQLGHRIDVVPVKDNRGLHISFPTPDLLPFYKSQPGHYLGHLLGHEGQGSLLSELKRRGWANNIVGGPRTGARGFGFFSVDVDLSIEGMKHVDEIVVLVFQYLQMLKEAGPQEWVHQECHDLGTISFRFKDKENPEGYVCRLSTEMHCYPFEEVLCAPYLMPEFKPELITSLLDNLRPDNMAVVVTAKEFESAAQFNEPWYGVHYNKYPISAELIDRCKQPIQNDNLHLPKPNEFIPTKFDLYEKEVSEKAQKGLDGTVLPELIVNEPLCRMFYKQDDEFLLPKCCVFVQLTSPLVYATPLNSNLTHMFTSLLHDSLTELVYNAQLAGLKYGVQNSKYGLVISLRGYNEKLHLLLERVVEKMANFTVDPQRFEILKENYIRQLKNFRAEQPYQHAIFYTSLLLSDRAWSKDELLEEAHEMMPEQVQAFIPEFLSHLHFEAFVHGNSNRKDAMGYVQQLRDIVAKHCKLRPLFPSQLLRDREIKLSEGKYYVYETTNDVHSNSALEVYIQTGVQSTESNMLLELLCQILHEPCFDSLRTKEQLGYIVFSGARRSNGTQGLRFIIQGEKDPKYVESRVEAFLGSVSKLLLEMKEEEFEKHKKALAANRLEKPKRLSALAGHYWHEISAQEYHFDRDQLEVQHLRKITKDELLHYYQENISFASSKRRKLTIYVRSTTEKKVEPTTAELAAKEQDGLPTLPEGEKIENIVRFKAQLPLFPLLKPYIEIPQPPLPTRAKL